MSLIQSPYRELMNPTDIASPVELPGMVMVSRENGAGQGASGWATISEFILANASTLGFVTPEMYGAVGGGIVDDSQAFADAAASGKTIVCGPKTYRVKNWRLPSHTSVVGSGPGKTIVAIGATLPSGTDCNNITNSNYSGGNTDIHIANLSLDGSQSDRVVGNATGTGINGLYFYNVSKFSIVNVEAYAAGEIGIFISGNCSHGRVLAQGHNNHQEGIVVSPSKPDPAFATPAIPVDIDCSGSSAWDNALVSGVGDQAIFGATNSSWLGGFCGGIAGRGPNSAFVIGSDFAGTYSGNRVSLTLRKCVAGANLQRCPRLQADFVIDDMSSADGLSGDGLSLTAQGGVQPVGSQIRVTVNNAKGHGVHLVGASECALDVIVIGCGAHGVFLEGVNNGLTTVKGSAIGNGTNWAANGNLGDGVNFESGACEIDVIATSNAGTGIKEVSAVTASLVRGYAISNTVAQITLACATTQLGAVTINGQFTLANNKSLLGTYAGTDYNIAKLDATAVVQLGDAASGVFVGIPTKTPASAAAAGTANTIAWDASYVYICTATNTWKRVAIATW